MPSTTPTRTCCVWPPSWPQAPPFFLRGSGYAEGTLFPWTMSDFSLMDAIECGIVKLPRVPVADNIPGGEMPVFRDLWEHIRPEMPKKGRGKAAQLDPLKLPTRLITALEALYGHYQKTYELWERAGIRVPPCFIVVCNNTATSKLVYDYLSGFQRRNEDGSTTLENGRLPLFRNFDEDGKPLGRPKTLLIDSEQLESGEALDEQFRSMAADEIERFRRVAEAHPRVRAYVKNHNLGLEVPYRYGSVLRGYRPDFIVRIDDGHGDQDMLNLIVEIKGYRREDAKEKKAAMETRWVPGVNRLGSYGRWAFAEFTEVYEIDAEFQRMLAGLVS